VATHIVTVVRTIFVTRHIYTTYTFIYNKLFISPLTDRDHSFMNITDSTTLIVQLLIIVQYFLTIYTTLF